MRRILFEIPFPFFGSIPVYAYGFMLMVGFLAGIYVARRRARSMGIDPDLITDIGFWAIICGIVGARVLFVAQNWDEYRDAPLQMLAINKGGLVFYGGGLCAMAALLIILRRRKAPVWLVLDIVAPSLALGLGFGRIGCFMNGCCYGSRCDPDMPFAVRFPRVVDREGRIVGSPVFQDHLEHGWVRPSDTRSLPVHPTQLYASAAGFCMFGILSFYFPRRRRHGDVALLLAILYPCWRIFIEFIRCDNPPLFDGLTISQNISLLVLCVSAPLFLRSLSLPRTVPASDAGGEAKVPSDE